MSLIDENCFWYYSEEKKAIVVRNCSSKVIHFNLDVDDAYVIINNREENLVDNDCIFQFQSGILPKSERVLVDLSGYDNDKIQSIVLVADDVYYEFIREESNLFLIRVVNSGKSAERSYYDNLDNEIIKGKFCRCDVDLLPLMKKNYYRVKKSFEFKENQDFVNELKREFLSYTLSQIGIEIKSCYKRNDVDNITLKELFSTHLLDSIWKHR